MQLKCSKVFALFKKWKKHELILGLNKYRMHIAMDRIITKSIVKECATKK